MAAEKPDAYTLQARVAAAALAAAPALALGLAALPVLPGAHKLWGLLALGVTTYAGLVARQRGDEVQPELWASWGGAPTVRRLRYQGDASVEEITRRHKDVEAALRHTVTLPSAQEERADPAAADVRYQEATRRLNALVRGEKSAALMQTENRQYGFARNLLGLKPVGVRCSWVVLALSLVAGLAVALVHNPASAAPLGLPVVVGALGLVLWRQVNESFVRPSAEAYADRLLEAAQGCGHEPQRLRPID